MKRTPLLRKTPMRRGYRAKPTEENDEQDEQDEQLAPHSPSRPAFTPKARMATFSQAAVPIPKNQPARHEGYRRLVATHPCKACGIQGFTQVAHANHGKGMGMKADDRTCFALCGPRPGEPGCHAMHDQGGTHTREQRREIEAKWGAETRAQILQDGLWPANLPHWPEDVTPP